MQVTDTTSSVSFWRILLRRVQNIGCPWDTLVLCNGQNDKFEEMIPMCPLQECDVQYLSNNCMAGVCEGNRYHPTGTWTVEAFLGFLCRTMDNTGWACISIYFALVILFDISLYALVFNALCIICDMEHEHMGPLEGTCNNFWTVCISFRTIWYTTQCWALHKFSDSMHQFQNNITYNTMLSSKGKTTCWLPRKTTLLGSVYVLIFTACSYQPGYVDELADPHSSWYLAHTKTMHHIIATVHHDADAYMQKFKMHAWDAWMYVYIFLRAELRPPSALGVGSSPSPNVRPFHYMDWCKAAHS